MPCDRKELVHDLRERKIRYLRERAKPGTEDEPPVDDPFPMRLCLIGGKYDEFRELHSGDDKESIGQALRAAAHVLGAGLHYHSAKDSHLLRRTKELLSHYGFKGQSTSPWKASVTDYDKPLSIAAGSDSFSAIDLKISRYDYAVTLDEIKQIYVRRFPQVLKNQDVLPGDMDDPANDPNFNEPIVDRLRLQREQEISVLLRDMLEAPLVNIPIPESY
ncbi:hypothetical protein TSAR_013236 [Trichomalopsis sarcophagae]|uniref:Uncharacterized protein n=1 Tax=Trichomalopsis sarcophagae TaxID=543379 RepID=A0A232EX28_9HYME|nr:hypothetical protein TSAR_013236 [Trichomalopsis sarcophagae]